MPPIISRTATPSKVEEFATSHGTARAHVFAVPHGVPRASLILGHGTAGIHTPDLATLALSLPGFGIEVVLAEQPWRVAGQSDAPDVRTLDEAWIEMVMALRRSGVGLRRLAVGGHSAGGRVACRTVAATKPASVLCLAFPLRPSRSAAHDRGDELAVAAAAAPTIVVQGTLDRRGSPADVAASVAEHGDRVLAVALPFVDHDFHLKSRATITDAEAREILVEAARRAVLRTAGNIGPLLAR